jgi:hypothetical protein
MFSLVKNRYVENLADPVFRFSSAIAIIAFIITAFINYYAGTYATEQASNSVTDIILSNTPVFDVDAIFVYGSLVLTTFIGALMLIHPKRIPFTLLSVALFVFTRSIFISLTHIGPFPSQTVLDLGSVTDKFIFGGDLFFSGHTGIPFLMALVFWQNRYLRFIFILWSVVFGVTALLGHLHYTIDVLSAFFITYAIFHIAEILFKKERALFHRD